MAENDDKKPAAPSERPAPGDPDSYISINSEQPNTPLTSRPEHTPQDSALKGVPLPRR